MCYGVPCRAMGFSGQSFIKPLPRSSLFSGSDRRWEKSTKLTRTRNTKKLFDENNASRPFKALRQTRTSWDLLSSIYCVAPERSLRSYAIRLTWHSICQFELVCPSYCQSDALQGPMILLIVLVIKGPVCFFFFLQSVLSFYHGLPPAFGLREHISYCSVIGFGGLRFKAV